MSASQELDSGWRALGAELAAARQFAGYTQGQLADLVHYTRSTIANVETGRQRAPADFWQLCDRLLGSAPTLSDRHAELARSRRSWKAELRVAEAGQAREQPPGIRPSGTGAAATQATPAWTRVIVPQQSRGRARTDRDPGGGVEEGCPDLRDCSVEEIHGMICDLSRAYLHAAPVDVYDAARRLADQLMDRLHDQVSRSRRRDLYLGSGYVHAMLGWMAGDLGLCNAATSHNRTAWLCAEITDHPTLRAWVLSTTSKTAMWNGRPADAAEFAARGQHYRAGGTATVMLACQEADAYAHLGMTTQAQHALARSEEAAAKSGIDEIGGLLACGELRRDNYISSVLLRGSQPANAIGVATAALASLPSARQPQGTVAQIRICAAQAHLAVGDLEQAAATLSPVLEIPPERRLATVAGRVLETQRMIDERADLRGHAVARALSSAITSYCAASPAPQHEPQHSSTKDVA